MFVVVLKSFPFTLAVLPLVLFIGVFLSLLPTVYAFFGREFFNTRGLILALPPAFNGGGHKPLVEAEPASMFMGLLGGEGGSHSKGVISCALDEDLV